MTIRLSPTGDNFFAVVKTFNAHVANIGNFVFIVKICIVLMCIVVLIKSN